MNRLLHWLGINLGQPVTCACAGAALEKMGCKFIDGKWKMPCPGEYNEGCNVREFGAAGDCDICGGSMFVDPAPI
jgi:hypothetical protein